ncbi:hypothetical protein EDF61_102283 [Arthrobacter sp. JUb115]|nr:hypothetical protein EDF61_102283 [Arthrobacter sp. JUb115]
MIIYMIELVHTLDAFRNNECAQPVWSHPHLGSVRTRNDFPTQCMLEHLMLLAQQMRIVPGRMPSVSPAIYMVNLGAVSWTATAGEAAMLIAVP